MCPARNAYFDLAHTSDPDDWGAAWAGFVPLSATVDWDPVPEGAEDIAPRVLGVEACFWGEFTVADRQAEPMIAPRILGIACKAWECAAPPAPPPSPPLPGLGPGLRPHRLDPPPPHPAPPQA